MVSHAALATQQTGSKNTNISLLPRSSKPGIRLTETPRHQPDTSHGRPKVLSGPRPHRRRPQGRPKQNRSKRRLAPIRAPLQPKNERLPREAQPPSTRHTPPSHPRPTLPPLGNSPRLLPLDETGLPRMADLPQEAPSGARVPNMPRLWLLAGVGGESGASDPQGGSEKG